MTKGGNGDDREGSTVSTVFRFLYLDRRVPQMSVTNPHYSARYDGTRDFLDKWPFRAAYGLSSW
jgi:hypothetical protein